MTNTLPTTAAGCAGLLCLCLVETVDAAGPWAAGTVVTLLGFLGLILRWLTARQDKMHEENREKEKERAKLEAERAKELAAQTVLLQACVEQLKQINERVHTVRDDIAAVPDRVVARLADRGFQRRAPT